VSLRSIDLNLLVVLDALVEEPSVRHTASRIGLSQSATSHALERLRKLLDDELLVRTSTGMEPTPRALELADPVRLALEEIQGERARKQVTATMGTPYFRRLPWVDTLITASQQAFAPRHP
jgi:DNA-binding transcriptional LysR family regulator